MITQEQFNNIREKIKTTGEASQQEFQEFSIYLHSSRKTTPQQIEREKSLPHGWRREFIPKLPDGWNAHPEIPDSAFFRVDSKGMIQVIVSASVEQDAKRWLHVSISRKGLLPDWDDLKLVKNVFIGTDRAAIQILPKESEFINIHQYVLHLWSCLDDNPLPDFSQGTGSI